MENDESVTTSLNKVTHQLESVYNTLLEQGVTQKAKKLYKIISELHREFGPFEEEVKK